ncbi:hypothetical protein ACLUYJ_21065, partial [Acinetobacter baumannii]|uniref:hypothetical protein n=1 Tax=Acinetobacter baumannii TaxID=470 RepID=UPI003996A22C
MDYNLAYSITHTNTTPGSGVPFTWGTTDFGGGYSGGGGYFQNRPVYWEIINQPANINFNPVSYTHLRAHETGQDIS